ncbi:MAG: UDP-N-acetylmuramoyl-L-alanine--D-glutamate ligase [Calditrichaeota bacterium]|nr:UDP-N-acetylmuramoyl-L-alanine--D-glutamate ligase [Calditrichota bacterium]
MNVSGKKITVLGAARSGIAAARMLMKHGASVFVSDSASPEKRALDIEQLNKDEIEFELGQHSHRVYEADCAVLSPGIPVVSGVVQAFYKKNIPVYAEVEAAWWLNKSPVIGVTGSNGKTTTTSLIGEMLRQKDSGAIVAGNIGQPFSEYVDNSNKERWAVIELSSFQLETVSNFAPKIAVVLNFAPNHLDRYPSYEAYLEAKWRITQNMDEDDLLVYNADDEKLSQWASKIQSPKLSFAVGRENAEGAAYRNNAIYLFGKKLIDEDEIVLQGIHNYMNVMAAALAANKAGIGNEQICAVLKTFSGIEHRLEKVAEIDNVLYVNDSKATTVESLYFALQSFKTPIVLIAGGKDKGSDFSKLNKLIAENVKELVLIGTAADKMAYAWQGIKPANKEKSMKDAVQRAAQIAEEGDVVLLSPACASFDMFSDYEERGRQFKETVLRRRKMKKVEKV